MGCLQGPRRRGRRRGRRARHHPRRGARLRGDPGARRVLGAGAAVMASGGRRRMIRSTLTKSLRPQARSSRALARGPRRREHRHHRLLRARGKSVTLKLIVGLLEPDAGEVDGGRRGRCSELDREELAALRGRIGYVFQFAALFDSMTVAENIRAGAGAARARRGRRSRERIEREPRAWSSSPGTEDKYPAELSRRHAQAGRHRAGDRAQAALHSLRRADDRARSGHLGRHGPAHGAHPRSRRHRASSSPTTCAAPSRVGDRIAMLYEGTHPPGRAPWPRSRRPPTRWCASSSRAARRVEPAGRST